MFMRALFAALLVAAGPVLAHESDDDSESSLSRPVDETRPLKADGRLFIGNTAGSIEVQAWDKNQVRVTGQLGDQKQTLEISGDDSNLRIEVKVQKKSRDNLEDTYLRVQVPAGTRLELEGVSSDIAVQGLKGSLHAQSVSGDVRLGVDSADVEAQTVSGSVTLRAPTRSAKINTVSGDVRVSGAREKLYVETVSGDVGVESDAIAEMELKSVSGDLTVDVGTSSTPKIRAETLSGEIFLSLAREPDAMLSLHSFSGELSTAYGAAVPEGKKRYEAKLGSGKGEIDLNSFSGDIHVSKGRR
jgi:DUF4097 and DUF4098 domain-containing protein YvlB